MMHAPGIRRFDRVDARGFTLIEVIIALSVFAVLGYSISVVVGAGRQTERTVAHVSSDNRALRSTTDALLEDVSATRDTSIVVADLADGNNEVRFMQPITVGGALGWGVYDRSLGPDVDSQTRAGWCVRYTVRDKAVGDGTTVKELVRQILDDALDVQKEQVLTTGLRPGGGSAPGFKMLKVGEVWELTLSTQSPTEHNATTQVFHVRTRN